jgi:Family of unknown function (DUF6350)
MAGTPTDSATAPPHRAPPIPPTRSPAGRRAPVLLAAAVTATWAAIVSYAAVLAVVALLVLVSGGAPVPVVLRFGTGGWLLAHGVPLSTGAGPFGLTPLAVSALAAWRVNRAGVHTARAVGARRAGSASRPAASAGLAALAAACVAVCYGLLGALAAAAVTGRDWTARPLVAGLSCGGFALLAAGAGAAAESGGAARLWRRLPRAVRDAVRTGLVAALLVLGAGAGVAGVTVAVAGGEASSMFASYHTGVAGQAGLTLLCLAFAPNLAVWATAYLVGPGFAVGVGTTVSAAKVNLGALPAVPVLAGLPTTPVSGWTAPLLGLPLAAGMAAGALLIRRQARERANRAGAAVPGWGPVLLAAVVAGPVAGILLGLAAWASGGPLGSGRLAHTGPAVVPVALVVAGVVAVGALIGAATMRVLEGVKSGTGKVRA